MKYFIDIDSLSAADRESAGDKAYNLALLKKSGSSVPDSTALKASAYKDYLDSSGMNAFILRELKRKKINDYRWEELWDISLRIKNAFVRHEMPQEMQNEISAHIQELFSNRPVAVRSSAPGEDGSSSSFAGLHESYINLTDMNEILKHIKLVWASLWSVSALLYRRELKLDPFKSAMAVLIQEVIAGDSSGVAFSMSPDNPEYIAIEAVHGFNQGLVDGSVEPDHWDIDRKNMKICDFFPAEHSKIIKASDNQLILTDIAPDKKTSPPLNQKQVLTIASEAMRQENYFGHPRDLEWTIRAAELFLLQSRPITQTGNTTDSRKYYDNLILSFEQLKNIRGKLENEILPGMLKTGQKWQRETFEKMSCSQLLQCLVSRGEEYRRCLNDYEKYCIPFAHGVRLFGEIYNSKLKPDDPYEFVDLLRTGELLSLKRNRKIIDLSKRVAEQGNANDDSEILDALEEFFGCRCASLSEIPGKLLNLLDSYRDAAKPEDNKKTLEDAFLNCFADEEKDSMLELLDLARASYRLRDDDNIYLDGVKNGLIKVRNEAAGRLRRKQFNQEDETMVRDELAREIPELHSPAVGTTDNELEDGNIKFRQLTGQPAGKGIAKGRAKIVNEFNDLFDFKKGDVLVCDAVEPEMTIVAPLAAALVERRGGMLIHGAIIAREYGLPCVTGVPKATVKIKNGDMLSVDGWLGIVTIL